MRAIVTLGVVLVLIGSGLRIAAAQTRNVQAQAPSTQPTPTPQAPTFIVTAPGTRYFTTANVNGPYVTLGTAQQIAEARNRYDEESTLRLIEERGEMLHVRTLGNDFSSDLTRFDVCTRSNVNFSAIELDLFVRKSDVMEVTTREATISFADGTQFRMMPGVVLWPHPSLPNKRVVVHPPFRFEIDVSALVQQTQIGHSYSRPSFLELPTSGDELAIANMTSSMRIMLGSENVTVLAGHTDAQTIKTHARRGDQELVRMRNRCSELTVLAPARLVTRPSGSERMLLGALGSTGDRVSANATAYWPSGARAGTTTAAFDFTRELARRNGRRCFARDLHERSSTAADATLELCFDAGVQLLPSNSPFDAVLRGDDDDDD